MRRYNIIFIILFCFTRISLGQNSKIDSLLTALSHSKEDTNKVNILNDLGRELIFVRKYDSAIKYTTYSKTLSEKKVFKKGIAQALNVFGLIYYYQGNYTTALQYYLQSLNIYEKEGTNHFKGGRKGTSEKEGSNNTQASGDVLNANFNYTYYELCRMPVAKLCKVSEQLLSASKKVKRLEVYGITQGEIKEAQAYYEEYKAVKDKPTQVKKEVAGRNEAISEGIRDCIFILENRMDRLVRLATRDDATLRRQYEGCRVIIGKMFGRPSDRESRFRKSRKKKIDAHELIRRYVRFFRKNKMPVTEAILNGAYVKRQAYSNSKIEVALVMSERDAKNIVNTSLAPFLNKKFPTIVARFYSEKEFNSDNAFISRIKLTGVKVEI